MQYKYHISINRIFGFIKIDKCWHQRKRIIQSSNYGSYASPNIHNFDSSFDDEDNFDIFYMNNNNEIERVCLFEENSDNNDKISKNGKSFDNYQSTETISFSSYYITFNDLFNVIKNNNEISTFIASSIDSPSTRKQESLIS